MMARAALLLLAPLLLAAAPAKAQSEAKSSDPKTETLHVVRDGETIGGIAQRAEVPRVLIIEANGLKPPYRLRKGQELIIPRRRIHTVKAGETGFAIAYQYGIAWKDIAIANGLDPAAKIRPGAQLAIPTMAADTGPVLTDGREQQGNATKKDVPAKTAKPNATATSRKPGQAGEAEKRRDAQAPQFRWPAEGPIRRGFVAAGRRNAHPAIDIAAKEGAPVRASAKGKVVFAGEEPRRFGNLVIIDHGNGWHTAYAKLQKIMTRKDRKVRPGDRIGLVGNTGETPSTELHFEIRRNNGPVDPLVFLPEEN